MATKNQSGKGSSSKRRTKRMGFGEPKAVGPQVEIDEDNPKPPGVRPPANPPVNKTVKNS